MAGLNLKKLPKNPAPQPVAGSTIDNCTSVLKPKTEKLAGVASRRSADRRTLAFTPHLSMLQFAGLLVTGSLARAATPCRSGLKAALRRPQNEKSFDILVPFWFHRSLIRAHPPVGVSCWLERRMIKPILLPRSLGFCSCVTSV